MNRAACYLGLDLGATNAKAALVDDDGRVVRYASLALGPGAARLAPERVAAALASCAATAVAGDWRAVAGCGRRAPQRLQRPPAPGRDARRAQVAAAYADARAAGAEARARARVVRRGSRRGRRRRRRAVVDDAAAHAALGCLNLARVLDCDVVVLAGGAAPRRGTAGASGAAAPPASVESARSAGPCSRRSTAAWLSPRRGPTGCIGAAAVALGAGARAALAPLPAAALAALAAAAAAAVALRRQKSIRMLFPGGLR
ncbi:hypothetical protein JL720_11752 [Aureococcus anophagefferens]|nr:hypothetical protein JL720_11752 [Aureococcus anophagefferens]